MLTRNYDKIISEKHKKILIKKHLVLKLEPKNREKGKTNQKINHYDGMNQKFIIEIF